MPNSIIKICTSQITSWLSSTSTTAAHPLCPIVIGLSGPQGSGKTTLVNSIKQHFGSHCIALSLDDFYLTKRDQDNLRQKHSSSLFHGRGNPGTHDLDLAERVLRTVLVNNEPVALPSYDKSAFNGKGDRIDPSKWEIAHPPFKIILLEGWMMGFKALSQQTLEKQYQTASVDSYLKKHSLQDLVLMNEYLREYEERLYPMFDYFICLTADDINNVFAWRWEQELSLKKAKGDMNAGMSEEEVRLFVERFMPAYELGLPTLQENLPGCGSLRIRMNKAREIVKVENA